MKYRNRSASLARAASLVLAVLAATSVHASAPNRFEGYTKVRALGGIEEYRLDSNGLTVLLVQDRSAPVVAFDVTYRVGSRNEVTGTTGSTHLLEHLMFKGSEHYNDLAGNSVKQYLERVGADFNATTSTDRTNYYATLGSQDLEEYVAIEADRMRHLWLHETDRSAEMTVVRNEFERGKNNPDRVLNEEVTAAAYQALPYHHPTLGWRSDIENVSIGALKSFYDTFYWPNNATVVIAGDFEAAQALAIVKKYYGALPSSPQPIPAMYTEEPEQTGPRRVTIKRRGQLGTVMIAHKVPNARDPDLPALAVLDGILGNGKTSRLYRALIDSGLALSVSSDMPQSHDLALHWTTAGLAPGSTHEKIEAALVAELERVKAAGVTESEVSRVKQLYLATEDYKRDGVSRVVAELNELIAAGEWSLYVSFPEAVARVTPADVQRVARKYLIEDHSTVGWFVPLSEDKT
jgi:zinc protease